MKNIKGGLYRKKNIKKYKKEEIKRKVKEEINDRKK